MSIPGSTLSASSTHALTCPSGRFQLSKRLRTDSKGAVKVTVKVLSTVAAVTQDVPYMGTISKILSELLKIGEEIETFKSEWESVMTHARQIKTVVDNVYQQCEATTSGPLPRVLKEPFDSLEKCLVQTLEVLFACGTKEGESSIQRLKSRARMAFNRKELFARVVQCRGDMRSALDLFTMKLQIDQSSTMHAMATILLELREKQLPMQAPLALSFDACASTLPSAPSNFHGRSSEIEQIIASLLSSGSPQSVTTGSARIAILGPGGIGKTSVSLSVLHHPAVEKLYAYRRYFLSCEACFSSKSIVQQLLSLLNLAHDVTAGITPQDCLISYLRALPNTILCLDNLETPWDMDVQSTEDLLSRLAALPHLALIVTKRGTDRPLQVAWSQPFLPPLESLTPEAASATWKGICGSPDDYSVQLMRAVDYVPLAVTLLAHLAVSESSGMLWKRWGREQTNLLHMHGPEHRLTNVAVSIRLSLCGPRIQGSTSTLEFFSALCMLPQGLPESRLPAFLECFTDLWPDILGSMTLLKQLALVFASADGYLRVLSPIRHYTRAVHPASDIAFARLERMYCKIATFPGSDYMDEKKYAEKSLQCELGNVSEVLRTCLARRSHQAQKCEQILEAIYHFLHLSRTVLYYDVGLLQQAISCAYRDNLQNIEAELRALEALYFYGTLDSSAALASSQRAIDLYRTVGDCGGEADCLLTMSDVYQRSGTFEQSNECLRSALRLYEGINDMRGTAGVQERLGRLYTQYGLHHSAQAAFTPALAIYTDVNDVLGIANCKHSLGELYIRQGRFEEAQDELQAALEYHREICDKRGEAIALQSLSVLFLNTRHLAKAGSAIELSLQLYQELDDGLGKASSQRVQGMLFEQLGRLDDSEATLTDALEFCRTIGSHHDEAKILNRLGHLYRALGRKDEAYAVSRSALKTSETISYAVGQGNASRNLGLLCQDKGELDSAEDYLGDALRFFKIVHHSEKVKNTEKDIDALCALRTLCSGTQRDDTVSYVSDALGSGESFALGYLAKMPPLPSTASISDPETGRLTRTSSRASSSSRFSSHSRSSRRWSRHWEWHEGKDSREVDKGGKTGRNSVNVGKGEEKRGRKREGKGRKKKGKSGRGGKKGEQVPTD